MKLLGTLIGTAIGLTLYGIVAWATSFIGAVAVGSIASIFADVALFSNALLYANYSLGLVAFAFIIGALLGVVVVEEAEE